MAEGRVFKKNLEVRLKTVEEHLIDIISRIGLLDEQARQASYRAWLAAAQYAPIGSVDQESAGRPSDVNRRLTETRATTSPRDDRDARLTSRRSAHTTR